MKGAYAMNETVPTLVKTPLFTALAVLQTAWPVLTLLHGFTHVPAELAEYIEGLSPAGGLADMLGLVMEYWPFVLVLTLLPAAALSAGLWQMRRAARAGDPGRLAAAVGRVRGARIAAFVWGLLLIAGAAVLAVGTVHLQSVRASVLFPVLAAVAALGLAAVSLPLITALTSVRQGTRRGATAAAVLAFAGGVLSCLMALSGEALTASVKDLCAAGAAILCSVLLWRYRRK